MAKISIVKAVVTHQRLTPKINSFRYKVFYVSVPVDKNGTVKPPKLFSVNHFNLLSVFNRDHGAKIQNTDWYEFINQQLNKIDIKLDDSYDIKLIAHPRILGFAFNPISYWLVLKNQKLIAVMCEVRNTFKQSHNYLLSKPDKSEITFNDTIIANKYLFVSPFNQLSGHYEFKFEYLEAKFKSVINYFNDQNEHIVTTYVGGSISDMKGTDSLVSVLRYPLMTFMVVFRINWQALKLFFKRVKPTLYEKPNVYENNQTTYSSKLK